MTAPNQKPPEATYRPADQVVCEGQPVFDSWAKTNVPSAEQSSSSSYTSRQRVSAAHSTEAERDQRLRLKSMQEFGSALAAIRGN